MIPTKFKLLNNTIRVKYKDNLMAKKDCWGQSIYLDNVIVLQKGAKKLCGKDQQRSTFWHESVHFILHTMGEYDLQNNEKFVSLFSDLLHQMEKTSKYKKGQKCQSKKKEN